MSDSEPNHNYRWRPFTIWTRKEISPSTEERKEAIPIGQGSEESGSVEPRHPGNSFTIWTQPGGIRPAVAMAASYTRPASSEPVVEERVELPEGRPFTVWTQPGGIRAAVSAYTVATEKGDSMGGEKDSEGAGKPSGKEAGESSEKVAAKSSGGGLGCLPWVLGLLAIGLLAFCLFQWAAGNRLKGDLTKERDGMQEQLTAQADTNALLAKDKKDLEKVRTDLEAKQTDLEAKLGTTVKEHRAEIDALNGTLLERDKRIAEVEKELNASNKLAEESAKEKESLTGDVEYLKKSMAESKAGVEKLTKEKSALGDRVKELDASAAKAQEASKKEMSDLAAKLKATEADWKKKVSALEKQKTDLAEKVKASDEIGKDLVQKLENAAKEKNALENNWKTRLEALRDELNKLKENSSSDDEDI